MPYLYMCTPCARTDAKKALFYTERDRGPFTTCPYCRGKTAELKKAYKKRAGLMRHARDLDVATRLSDRATRKGRGRPAARLIANDEDESAAFAAMAQDYDPRGDAGAEDDPEYAPRKEFNPAMRLTDDGTNATCRPRPMMMALCQHTLTMRVAPPHRITVAAGRADTGTTMARHLKATRPALATYRTLSAYTWANWGDMPPQRGRPHSTHPKLSLEWCHLVADSLGGPTSSDNLVAASYAANTAMLAIEQPLNARTTMQIEIIAWCCRENVAEFLDYRIIRPDGRDLTITIDARNDAFTRHDHATLGQQVAAFIR